MHRMRMEKSVLLLLARVKQRRADRRMYKLAAEVPRRAARGGGEAAGPVLPAAVPGGAGGAGRRRGEGEGGRTQAALNVFYQYTFNLQKNMPRGGHVGCIGTNLKDACINDAEFPIFGIDETDVIIALHWKRELAESYFPRLASHRGGTAGVKPSSLPDLRILGVNNIYEAFLSQLLKQCQVRNGFLDLDAAALVASPPYGKDLLRARFRSGRCSPQVDDIHFRLPGITDLAVEAWMQGVASWGLWEDGQPQHGE